MKKSSSTGEYIYKHKIGLWIVLLVIAVIVIGMNTLSYPQRIKKIFVQSSVTSMEKKLEDEAEFTNENVEVNYEEVRLLAGLIRKYLNGKDEYTDNVLDIMKETQSKAGFEQIGIMKMDEESPFVTMTDGRRVKLDIWALDEEVEVGKVIVELQTSPFSTVDEGSDAIIYRYIFSDSTNAQYMLIAQKTQETLENILNLNDDKEGITFVIRNNGNIIYGSGSIAEDKLTSYNFWAYLDKLGVSKKDVKSASDNLDENKAGKFELNIKGEPYHFVFQNIENTSWICIKGYSESFLAGENLNVVNSETMKLVSVVVFVLVFALIIVGFTIVKGIRKHGEEKILARERLFEEMSRYIPSAFAIIQEGETKPNFISHNFYEIVQWTLEECSIQDVKEWIGRDITKEEDEIFNRDGVFNTIVQKANNYFSVGVYDIGIIDEKKYYALVFENVTQEVDSKKLLEDSMKRATAASDSKTKFLSKMSHEIRTPLNSVIGFSKIAIDEWDTIEKSELHEYICKIQNSGKYLLELVSDILDISRIEEGRMNIMLTKVSLDDMIDEIANSFIGQMKRKNIQFVVDKNYENIVLNMDQFHTKQIINNLISNAYKYTEDDGCVGLEVSANQLNDKQYAVQYIVQDTGIGMTQEFVEKIFEPFTQEDRGSMMKNQMRGSGLGMSICKNLVDLLQGSIKVESEVGAGSTFTVQLIYDIATGEVEKNTAEKKNVDYSCLKSKKILAADDVSTNLMVIEKLLKKYGLEFEEAENGQMAVEKYEQSEKNEYFAIFMDIHMPIMDGYLATEKIRKLERKDAKTIPIVAMTADAFSDDINKALLCGMNYHVTKPVEIEKVLDVLMEIYDEEEKKKNEN